MANESITDAVAKKYAVILHPGAEDALGFETDILEEAQTFFEQTLTGMAIGGGFKVLPMGSRSYVIPLAKVTAVEVRGFDVTQLLHRVEAAGYELAPMVGTNSEGRHED